MRATTAASSCCASKTPTWPVRTQDSVDQILASMRWLGLDYDEGPIYQMQRLARYHAVVEQMIAAGTAYRCWCTPAELDAMREAQRARGEKTGYDGRWRPAPGKVLPPVPAGVKPVVRFANPPDGVVTWDDLVKGPISISNDRDRRPDHPAARRCAHLQLRRGGRRLGHGHHPCLPR
jgi:glutamyl/glutaminyl-tRNA synthetase